MNIVIGADFIPTKLNAGKFSEGNPEVLFDAKLMSIIQGASFRIFNLEGPLYDEESPIEKDGPIIKNPTSSINMYKALNVDLFTLANNHIMDHGKKGLDSTIEVLKDAGISYIGAGYSKKEASKPYYFEFAGKTVGVFACAEHEFSIIDENCPGVNPVEYYITPNLIENVKRECDYLIMLYHGGKEFYRYPSPELQKLCHMFANKGADLILVQHTHCIGCEEKYKESTIVYGQGNFFFDLINDEYWNTSILVSIEEDYSIKYYFLEKKNGREVLSYDKNISDNFNKRNDEISRFGFVEEQYRKFALEMVDNYYRILMHESFGFKVANKLLHNKLRMNRKCKLSKEKKLALLNTLRCEAHRELFIKGILMDLDRS